jgi:hypothetical protein
MASDKAARKCARQPRPPLPTRQDCFAGRRMGAGKPPPRAASGSSPSSCHLSKPPRCDLVEPRLSVGYNTTRASRPWGKMTLVPQRRRQYDYPSMLSPSKPGAGSAEVPNGGSEHGNTCKWRTRRAKNSKRRFPHLQLDRARFIAALERRRPKLAGWRWGYRHNWESATLSLGRLSSSRSGRDRDWPRRRTSTAMSPVKYAEPYHKFGSCPRLFIYSILPRDCRHQTMTEHLRTMSPQRTPRAVPAAGRMHDINDRFYKYSGQGRWRLQRQIVQNTPLRIAIASADVTAGIYIIRGVPVAVLGSGSHCSAADLANSDIIP